MGYVAMGGGRSLEPDASFAWPTAEICAMSIDGAVDVAYRKEYEAAPDPVARRKEIIDDMRSRVSAVQAVEGFGIDDLIDPRTTRARLIEVLARVPARRVRAVRQNSGRSRRSDRRAMLRPAASCAAVAPSTIKIRAPS